MAFKRGKGKYNSNYKINDFYKWYVAHSQDALPKHMYTNILKEFITQIMHEIIFEAYEFFMGHGLGSIFIGERDYQVRLDEDGNVKKETLAPDWQKTLKKWRQLYPDVKNDEELKNIPNKPIIYFENEHSDYTMKRWFWNKIGCNIKLQNLYKFKANRVWNTKLAKAVKESNITYYKYR